MVEAQEQVCYSVAARRRMDVVPATEPGWDSRPRRAGQVLIAMGQIPTDT